MSRYTGVVADREARSAVVSLLVAVVIIMVVSGSKPYSGDRRSVFCFPADLRVSGFGDCQWANVEE